MRHDKDELDAIAYVQESAQAGGAFTYSEEYQRQAYETGLSLTEAATELLGPEDQDGTGLAARFEDPRKTVYERMANEALVSAGVIFRRIPMAKLMQLDNEHQERSENKNSAETAEEKLTESDAEQVLSQLTAKQREVFELLPLGLSKGQMASKLHVMEPALNERIKKVMQKTRTSSRLDASVLAYKTLHAVGRLQLEFPAGLFDVLEPSEIKIVKMVQSNFTNENIATALGLSTSTIKERLRTIYGKTGLQTRPQLAIASAVVLGSEKLPLATKLVQNKAQSASKTTDSGLNAAARYKSLKVEKELKPEQLLPTLGIQAARQIVKLIPSGNLDLYDQLTFTIKDADLLVRLRQLEAVSDEEVETGEIGVRGVAIALTLKTDRGQKYLGGGKQARNYAEAVYQSTTREIEKEINRKNGNRPSSS
jgi:DNA-binding NarL/FixJ family response regulator